VCAITNHRRWAARCIGGLAAIALTAYLLKRLAKNRRVLLFENVQRMEVRPKREREPIYDYYSSSARRPIAALRSLLQNWFDAYPASGRKDLLARFRSRIDGQHKSAVWELYLHELFTRMKYRLRVHPEVAGSTNHPDFLASEAGRPTNADNCRNQAISLKSLGRQESMSVIEMLRQLTLWNAAPTFIDEVKGKSGKTATPTPDGC
jgi:hypothetical protein